MIIFEGTRSPLPRVQMTITVNQVVTKRMALPFAPKNRAEPVYSKLGFDWGSDNSGSIELARTILRRILSDTALRNIGSDMIYKKFAAEVIQKLPRDTFKLTDVEIQDWLKGAIDSEPTTKPVRRLCEDDLGSMGRRIYGLGSVSRRQ